MKINKQSIRHARQEPYAFAHNEVPCDPLALANYYAFQKQARGSKNPNVRAYEKAKRLQRMAARANKERARRGE